MTEVDARRAGLVEERDHLLRSLEDLDAEHAAGDLDDADYRALRADYTTRAAEAIRALEEGERQGSGDDASPPTRSLARTTAWVVGVGVVALLAGVLLARFTGSRGAGETITGDIRTSAREQIFEAQQLAATGDRVGAIDVLDDVLEREPANAEALTWKGWFTNLSGDPVAARVLLDDAVASDPELPEARVFSASLALTAGDPEAAAGHLEVLDTLTAAPEVEQLLFQSAIRERTAALLGDPVPLVTLAEGYFRAGEALEAVMLVDEVLAERPDDVDLLAAAGWIYGRIADDALREASLERLDRALALDAGHPPSLVYRAIVRAQLGDLAGARADLDAFDAIESPPEPLLELVEASEVRAALAGQG